MKFRKKPVVIEAIHNEGTWPPIIAWLESTHAPELVFLPGEEPPVTRNNDGSLSIPTMEGTMRADVGDWIIRGVKGELYPCKPDIFEQTYDRVEDDAP